MNDADKYRDFSRYRNDNKAKSEINLGSNHYSRTSNSLISDDNHYQDSVSNNHKGNISKDNLSYKTAQYSRGSHDKYSHKHIAKKQRARKRKNVIRGIAAALILVVIGIAAYKLWPIKVNINNQEVTLTYDKSLGEAIAQSKIDVKPGNYVAVDFSVLKASEGFEYYAEVNDNEVDNQNFKLHDGDKIKYENGKDKMEDFTSNDSKIMAKSKIEGVGSIHRFYGDGEPGIWSQMKGKVSGKYAERQTKDPHDVNCKQYNVDPKGDKVIALTFDDGPSEDFTEKVLDLLKKYNAKATFFVIGENLEESWGQKLVAKEDSAGHQVCTHTYDHARGAGGVDITIMTAEKQIEEVTKGKATIAKAIKKDVSSVCRLPGGNLNAVTCRLLAPFVSAEIGWNIDTGDWQMPGAKKILSNMKLAASGDVILCHDGGGDRTGTVEALEDFLKEYTEKGYKFITIDELMKYDEAPQKESSNNLNTSYNYKYTD